MSTGFEARKPRFNDEIRPGESSGATPSASRMPPEVLVVEDDEALLPLLEFLIEEARPGCGVAWARSSEEAETWLNANAAAAKFRVVIADLFIRGGKNGVELWRRYGSSERSFLMISGASRERFLALVPDREAPLFLPKPLDLDACVETLRLMLANPGWY